MMQDINFLRFLSTQFAVGLYDNFFVVDDLQEYNEEDLKKEFSVFSERIRNGEIPRLMGVYVHIPFCAELCTFCHCHTTKIFSRQQTTQYIDQVSKQLLSMLSWLDHPSISSVYLGGGSPSLLSEIELERLFSLIFDQLSFDKGISIDFEAHIAQVSLAKTRILRSFGVDRLSLGVQSLDPVVLKAINRFQSDRHLENSFNAVREAGIPTINVDLVAGLPEQTLDSFLKDVQRIIDMGADSMHLTPFSDIQSTVYGKKLELGELMAVCRKRNVMIQEGKKILEKAGYRRYGFEAYAKEEKDGCPQEYNYLHQASSILGVGPYARGILAGHLQYEIKPVDKNMDQWGYSASRTDKKYMMAQFLILHMLEGISAEEFKQAFFENMDNVFSKELSFLLQRGIIIRDGSEIRYHGDRSMESLFEYFSFTRALYGDGVIKKCRDFFEKKYDPNCQYSFDKKDVFMKMMQDHWFLQLYYDVGL